MAWGWCFKYMKGIKIKCCKTGLKSPFGKISVLLILAAVLAGGYAFVNYAPLEMLTIQAKPEPLPQKSYDYYIIIEKETGIHLMFVPIVVFVGDELISEDNKRYVIVEIADNLAYASFVEHVRTNK